MLSPGNSPSKSSPFTRAVSGTGLFGNSYMSPGKALLVQNYINNAADSENIGETLLRLIESGKVRLIPRYVHCVKFVLPNLFFMMNFCLRRQYLITQP